MEDKQCGEKPGNHPPPLPSTSERGRAKPPPLGKSTGSAEKTPGLGHAASGDVFRRRIRSACTIVASATGIVVLSLLGARAAGLFGSSSEPVKVASAPETSRHLVTSHPGSQPSDVPPSRNSDSDEKPETDPSGESQVKTGDSTPPAGDRNASPASSSSQQAVPNSSPPASNVSQEPQQEPQTKPELKVDPFQDIRARNRRLVLPKRVTTDEAVGQKEIAKILTASPSDCDVAILGGEIVLGAGRSVAIQKDDPSQNERTWTLIPRFPAALGEIEGKPLGKLRLYNTELTFAWVSDASAPSWYDCLQYCLLKITVGAESITCFLNQPIELKVIKLEFKTRVTNVALPLDLNVIPSIEHLRFEVTAEQFPDFEMEPARPWKADESALIRIKDPDAVHVGYLFDLSAQITAQSSCKLTYEWVTAAKKLPSDAPSNNKEQRLTQSWLKGQDSEVEKTIKTRQKDCDNCATKISQLEGQLATVEATEPNLNNYSLLAQRTLELNHELEQWANNRQKAEDSIANATEYGEWLKSLRAALEQIANRGRLHLVAFVEIEGERIVLLETRK